MVNIAYFALWRVLPEKLFRDNLIVWKRFIHSENIGCLLWFVCAETSRCVQDARRNIPAGSYFKPISNREVRDFVVAFFKVEKGLADLFFGSAGFQAKEGVRKITSIVICLRRGIVCLGLFHPACALCV